MIGACGVELRDGADVALIIGERSKWTKGAFVMVIGSRTAGHAAHRER